jgi:hypothetical protein
MPIHVHISEHMQLNTNILIKGKLVIYELVINGIYYVLRITG